MTEMKQLDGVEIKETIYEILRAFADYCDRHELRYYLSGGTLLGAIRHKDFLPWDDDVDVLMPRPDYKKLHELVREEPISTYYELQSWQLGDLNFPFAKIIDNRTVLSNPYTKSDYGLWIDIFPMDGIPEEEDKSTEILEKAKKLKSWLNYSLVKIGTGRSKWKALGKIPFVILAKLRGTSYWANRMDTLAQQYSFEDSKYVAGIAYSCGARERMKKQEYVPTVDVEFHGSLFHAPACWDKYLRQMYGDYMKLPPENERVAHELTVYWSEEN